VVGSVGQGIGGQSEPKRPEAREPSGSERLNSLLPEDQLNRLPEEKRETLKALYLQAFETKPILDEIGEKIAQDAGGLYKPGPIKGGKRAISKIISDYNGDISRIRDLVRATIVVDTPEQAALAITEIRNRMTVLDSGFRNLLDPSKVDVRGGYRDVKMNIQLNGHIVEMQISIPEIMAVKKVRHLDRRSARSWSSASN